MKDLEIIKKCFYEMQGNEYWRDEGIAAAEYMAAEIERLRSQYKELRWSFVECSECCFKDNCKIRHAAVTDIYCSCGQRSESEVK